MTSLGEDLFKLIWNLIPRHFMSINDIACLRDIMAHVTMIIIEVTHVTVVIEVMVIMMINVSCFIMVVIIDWVCLMVRVSVMSVIKSWISMVVKSSVMSIVVMTSKRIK